MEQRTHQSVLADSFRTSRRATRAVAVPSSHFSPYGLDSSLQATFNHADPVVRAVTWEGWQCLMDNCTHDMAHLLRPKSKRTELLLKPYLSRCESSSSLLWSH